jgi:hypothetical protein
MDTGITIRVSVSSSGAQANNTPLNPSSNSPRISSDGRRIVFITDASNLDVGDTNGFPDIFIRDVEAGITNRAWTSFSGQQLNNGRIDWVHMSGDGNWLGFTAEASNLVNYDTNGTNDVFVYNTLAPGAPNGLTAQATSQSEVNLTWVDNSFAESGFNVERSPNGTSGWASIASIEADESSYQDTRLNCNTSIFYRVKSQGAGLTSVYSNVASGHTLSCQAPNAPKLSAPLNNAMVSDATPYFSWIPSGGVSFQVQIDDQPDFNYPERDLTVIGVNTELPTPLEEGLYYWRARGTNNLNQVGSWSLVRQFTIDLTPPDPPSLITVDGYAAEQPTLEWEMSPGAVQYEVAFDKDDPPVISVALTANPRYTVSLPIQPHTYYWQVRAIDAAGNLSGWSARRSVIVISRANAAPSLAYFAISTPTLSWSPISWAVDYEVEVDDDPGFATPDFRSGILNASTHAVITSPVADGIWYWRVHARPRNAIWGNWSPVLSFVIDTP